MSGCRIGLPARMEDLLGTREFLALPEDEQATVREWLTMKGQPGSDAMIADLLDESTYLATTRVLDEIALD